MSSNTPHDLGYKFLFSHPDLVRDLMMGFIDDDWLHSLDYSTLERVNSSYVSDDLRARSDDVVWRVRTGGEWVYLYLLFEFQSRVDTHMALRMMVYSGLLYQDLVKSGQSLARGRLPPVLPIVLYSGHRRWTAAQDIAELIPPLPHPMNGYTPQAKYLLIDENTYADHPLPSLRNLVAAVFKFERPSSPQAVVDLLGLLVIWIRACSKSPTGRAAVFSGWDARRGAPWIARLSTRAATPQTARKDHCPLGCSEIGRLSAPAACMGTSPCGASGPPTHPDCAPTRPMRDIEQALKDRPDLARVMSLWMSAHLHRKPALHGLIALTDNLQELKTMLDQPDRWTQWAEEYKAEGEMLGLEKGLEKGLQRGKHEGLTKAALLQLELRFSPLPDWVAPHLAQASESQLQAYLAGLLNACSLDELFERSGSAH